MSCQGCARRRAAMKKKAVSMLDQVRKQREALARMKEKKRE